MREVRSAVLLATGLAVAGCNGPKLDLGGPDGGAIDSGDGAVSSGDDGGATGIASQIQLTPTDLVSDGTSLFWASTVGPGGPILSTPVGGGAITTIVAGPVSGGFIAVDEVNVYYVGLDGGVYRAPKAGGSSSTIVEPAPVLRAFTVLGANLYWMEAQNSTQGPPGGTISVKSAPLKGGPTSTIAQWADVGLQSFLAIGVTTTMVFISDGSSLSSFPIGSGVPGGGVPAPIPGKHDCEWLVSDTDAVYCADTRSIIRVASDGTVTTLGPLLEESAVAGSHPSLAYDSTYVYWVDALPVGTIMRALKSGGTATVIAHDTSPVAVAVDDNAVYWSDVGGYIMRLAK